MVFFDKFPSFCFASSPSQSKFFEGLIFKGKILVDCDVMPDIRTEKLLEVFPFPLRNTDFSLFNGICFLCFDDMAGTDFFFNIVLDISSWTIRICNNDKFPDLVAELKKRNNIFFDKLPSGFDYKKTAKLL